MCKLFCAFLTQRVRPVCSSPPSQAINGHMKKPQENQQQTVCYDRCHHFRAGETVYGDKQREGDVPIGGSEGDDLAAGGQRTTAPETQQERQFTRQGHCQQGFPTGGQNAVKFHEGNEGQRYSAGGFRQSFQSRNIRRAKPGRTWRRAIPTRSGSVTVTESTARLCKGKKRRTPA